MPDATPAWIWAENLTEPGRRQTLADSESRYVARVCRARPGETLIMTDGAGGVARARIETLLPRVEVTVESRERTVPLRSATLLCGAPEGQRFDWVVEKLAELGVTTIRPVHFARSSWERGAWRGDRWTRLAHAALQQSRGRFLSRVEEPASLEEALAAEPQASARLMADPAGASAGDLPAAREGRTLAVIGPAEGMTEAEKSLLIGRGFEAIALAENRLRVETAAIAWASWWAAPAKGQGHARPESA